MNEEERRSTLFEILMGEQSQRPSEVDVSIILTDEMAKGSTVIQEITFSSNLIPRMRTNDDGTLNVEYVQENIPAYLLQPKKPNGKAIVAHHQHAVNYHLGGDEPAGLTGPEDMHYGLELAERGFVVLAHDALPFGKRFQFEKEKHARGGEQRANQTCSHNGFSYMGRVVLDASRAVDVLQARGYEQIGMIGHSFGGLATLCTMAVDTRITAGAISCGFSSLDEIDDHEILHGMAMAFPGNFRKEFVDMYSLLGLCQNRHLFISAGSEDRSLPLVGIEKSLKLARRLYGMGEEHLQLSPFDGGHSFPVEQRQKAYQFLEEHVQ